VGLEAIKEYIDSLIIVSNNQLLSVTGNKISIQDSFREADNILRPLICLSLAEAIPLSDT
ncbi:MAG: hypothetical protein II370_04405, partial [Clostridia bacterium]|nr:hypothetical protein [Clostridia bacterium]